LYKVNNYQTLMAFLGGFNNSCVARLKFTRLLVPKALIRVRDSLRSCCGSVTGVLLPTLLLADSLLLVSASLPYPLLLFEQQPQKMEELEKVMNMESSFKVYRRHLKMANPPIIPYM
jgi:RasGEF domain